MTVSVLISCHNYVEYVREAVASVLAQDYPGSIECVVVDDGSEDGSGEVLASFGNRIRYIRQQNRGQAAALTTAYQHCSGEVVCLLDADDMWAPGKVRRVVEALTDDSRLGLVHHDLVLVDRDGSPTDEFPIFTWDMAEGDVSSLMWEQGLPWRFSPTSGLSLPRWMCEHLFPLESSLKSSADELIAPLAALLAPVEYLREPLGFYRYHGSNVWASEAVRPERGEVERRAEDARYIALLEEKMRHANRVLARAGRDERLSPWVLWPFVKAYARVNGGSPARYLGRSLRALPGASRLKPGARLGKGIFFLRKWIKYLGRPPR